MPKISIIVPSAPDRSEKEILENIKKISPANVETELFIIKGTWPPLQRNLGIKKATGEYIFFFDDDVVIPAGSIEKALETFEKNAQVEVVGGPNLTPETDNFLQHCFGEAHASYFAGLQTAVRYRKVKKLDQVNENHLITCNLAFRSKILKENLFNPDLYANEENELLGRIVRKGNLLAYNPEFFVYHHRRKTLFAYLKQIFKWGEGRSLHTLKQPGHFKITFFIPLLFLCYMLSLIFIQQWWYFLPFQAYIILALSFSIVIAANEKKWQYVIVMPWIFILTHLIYAVGLFSGFIQQMRPIPVHPEEKDFQVFEFNFKKQ